MKRIIVILLVIISAVGSLHAQLIKKDTLELVLVKDIVISSSRITIPLMEIPFAASYVGRPAIEKLPRGIALDEPMKLVPGIKVDNQANGERVHVSIRGQGILSERGVRGIKVLLDGIPVNDPTGFAPDLYDIDFANVQNIEVLRGPAASLYGGSSAGGVVSITTKSAPAGTFSGEAYTSAGSNSFFKNGGQFGGNLTNLNYLVSLSRATGDGYRKHTAFSVDNFSGKATYRPSNTITLTPILAWTNANHENPEGINLEYYKRDPKLPNDDAIPFDEYLETKRSTAGLTGVIAMSNSQEISFNGYTKKTLFTEANNHTFNHRTIHTSGGTAQFNLVTGQPENSLQNHVSIGTDVQWQNYTEYRKVNDHSVEGSDKISDEKIKQSGFGLFVLDKLNFRKFWSVMLSMRYDKITSELTDIMKSPYDASGSADFSKSTMRIGLAYSPCLEWNVFVNWGQGFMPPATEELSQNPDNFGGFNTHLSSATSNGIDLGVRGILNENLRYDVTGFYLSTKNDFDRYRITDPLRNQETFYQNTGASKRYGLEIYAAYFPVKALELQAAYTYSNFKYSLNAPAKVLMDDPSVIKYINDGNFLPNSPEHQLYLDAQYRPIPVVSIAVAAELYSRSFIDGANITSEAVDGYTLFHARASYDCKLFGFDGIISLNLKNLTNKKYVAFSEPDPGGNAYQPGAGREVFGSFKIKFQAASF